MVERLLNYICIFLALILVLPVHEFAHAVIAVKCGDNTPKFYNRLTLNPISHFDLRGVLCFVLFGFGWAKPVPINPYNFRKRKRDTILVSSAGVLANYILAFIAYPLCILSLKIADFGYFTYVLQLSLYYVFSLSLVFFIFNLIPVYPLDGFRIVDTLTTRRGAFYNFLYRYGSFVLMGLFVLSFIADVTGFWQIDILGIAINFLVDKISIPIKAFWGLIF